MPCHKISKPEATRRPLPPASAVLFTVDGSLPRPGSKGTMQAPQAPATWDGPVWDGLKGGCDIDMGSFKGDTDIDVEVEVAPLQGIQI